MYTIKFLHAHVHNAFQVWKKWEIKIFFIFQFVFDVELEEDELMVSLEQWDKRIDRELGKENDTIGFFIMKASTHTTLL